MKEIKINTLIYTSENRFGLKMHQINKYPLFCFQLPRDVLGELKEEKLAQKPGIYFLLNRENINIYIGQTDNIFERLKKHIKDKEKDWFDEICFFVTEEDMSLTNVNYLEYHYISEFKKNENKAWRCNNNQQPNKPKLGRFEQPDVDAFIEGIDCYLLALNISTKNQLSDKTSNEHTFSFKKCKGRYKNGKFIILAGSSFIDKYDSVIQSLDKHCKRYNGQMERLKMFQGEINNLILDQKARRNNNNIELIYDWQINSPSKAAAIVACSYAINGWTVWKNYKGKSLDDMYRKNIDNN